MNTTGRVVRINGLNVNLYLNNKEDIAFALRHLADTIDDPSTNLVNGMFSYMSDTGRTVGDWKVV
jgi:hypothetical protein